MAVNDFADQLEVLATEALNSTDLKIRKAGIVLITLTGCMTDTTPAGVSLDSLAQLAGLICEHETGQHFYMPT